MGYADERRFAGTDGKLVQAVLTEYGQLTRRHLQAYLPQEEPRPYLYELVADYPRRGGKMLRSSLCIAMARATGASVRRDSASLSTAAGATASKTCPHEDR